MNELLGIKLNRYIPIKLNKYRNIKLNGFKKYDINIDIELKKIKKKYININTELNVYRIIEYCYNRRAIVRSLHYYDTIVTSLNKLHWYQKYFLSYIKLIIKYIKLLPFKKQLSLYIKPPTKSKTCLALLDLTLVANVKIVTPYIKLDAP